ncbi:hypothetical protein Tco_1339473 [Tanacetum coccineum]
MSNSNTNLQTQTSSVLQNDTVSSCSISNIQEKTQLSRSRCMHSLKEIKSLFKFLSETLQDYGTMPIFKRTDDESLLEEDVLKENFKIYSNHLFEFDDEYISSDVNPIFNEVLEDIESEDSYVSKLDEPDLLGTPLSKLNEDECFDPGGNFVLEEIEAFPTSDLISSGIDDAEFDPKGDILLLEKLEDEPDKDDLKNIVKARLFHSRVLWLVIYVKDCPDYEDSHAHGFVHRLLDLQSFACLYMGI